MEIRMNVLSAWGDPHGSVSLAIGRGYLPSPPSCRDEVGNYLSRFDDAVRRDPSVAPDITLAAVSDILGAGRAADQAWRVEVARSALLLAALSRDVCLAA